MLISWNIHKIQTEITANWQYIASKTSSRWTIKQDPTSKFHILIITVLFCYIDNMCVFKNKWLNARGVIIYYSTGLYILEPEYSLLSVNIYKTKACTFVCMWNMFSLLEKRKVFACAIYCQLTCSFAKKDIFLFDTSCCTNVHVWLNMGNCFWVNCWQDTYFILNPEW